MEDTLKALHLSKKYCIKVALSIIVANPAETLADKYATYQMIKRGKPEFVQTSVYNGAHIGLTAGKFERYDTRKRVVVRVDHEAGTWSGQSDRKVGVGA